MEVEGSLVIDSTATEGASVRIRDHGFTEQLRPKPSNGVDWVPVDERGLGNPWPATFRAPDFA